MKKLIFIISLFISIASNSQSAKNYLNTKKTIIFDNQNYHLVWSTHQNSNYYKQEYLQKDEKLESFKSMITIDFLKGKFKIGDLVNAKLEELKQLEKNNGIVSYNSAVENNDEIILEFIIGAYNKDGKTVKIIERNIYRYVQSNDPKSSGVLLFAISKRAYGKDVLSFLNKVKKDKSSLANKFVKIKIPKIKI